MQSRQTRHLPERSPHVLWPRRCAACAVSRARWPQPWMRAALSGETPRPAYTNPLIPSILYPTYSIGPYIDPAKSNASATQPVQSWSMATQTLHFMPAIICGKNPMPRLPKTRHSGSYIYEPTRALVADTLLARIDSTGFGQNPMPRLPKPDNPLLYSSNMNQNILFLPLLYTSNKN